MVIGDIFSSHLGSEGTRRSEGFPRCASAVARISSFAIDLIFLLPLLNLVYVPFQRKAQHLAFMDRNPLATFYLCAGLLTMAVTYIVVTSIVSHFLEGTIGQRLLGLRVKSSRGEKVTFFVYLVRQSSLFLSLGLAGLPLMSALYGRDHRTWVDRATNTLVESSSPKFVARWNEAGALWAKSCSVMIVTAALILGLSLLGHQYQSAVNASSTESASGCTNLKDSEVNQRLNEALTLFAAGQVNEDCLDQEANWALARRGSLPLIYLAKSFSKSKTDLSDRYLGRVCQEVGPGSPKSETQACRFSELIKNWTPWLENESPQSRVHTLLDIGAEYALVWGARQFFSRQWWKDTLALLEPLDENIAISEFVQIHKFRSLWSLGKKNQVRELFAETSGLWAEAPRKIMAESICAEDLEIQECAGAGTASCKYYLQTSQEKVHLNKKDSALVLQILSCPSHIYLALSPHWEQRIHKDLIPLWNAVRYLHQGDTQKAKLVLSGNSEGISTGVREKTNGLLRSLGAETRRSPSSKESP